MLTKIKKWGNSQGVRIPKAYLETLRISDEDDLEIITDQEKIIIKKANSNDHVMIKDRLETFYGKPIEDLLSKYKEPQEEFDWGKPVGKEI